MGKQPSAQSIAQTDFIFLIWPRYLFLVSGSLTLNDWTDLSSISTLVFLSQSAITCSKLTIETLDFTPCSYVSIVNFEQVNAGWMSKSYCICILYFQRNLQFLNLSRKFAISWNNVNSSFEWYNTEYTLKNGHSKLILNKESHWLKVCATKLLKDYSDKIRGALSGLGNFWQRKAI